MGGAHDFYTISPLD